MIETINLDKSGLFGTAGHSSKGNQMKWNNGDFCYKADSMGYEALSEIVISRILKHSNVENFVAYDPVKIEYKGKIYNGCKSKNFLRENESLITVEHLYRQYTGLSMASTLAKIPETIDRIKFLVDQVKVRTGLTNFGEYLTMALEMDAIFLNEDRHTNNIAVIYHSSAETTGYYRLCPYFDNGLALLADTATDFALDKDYELCIKQVEAKPFSLNFDVQMDEAEKLYNKQLIIKKIGSAVSELAGLDEMYDDFILKRVEDVIHHQMSKYIYMTK